MKTIIILTFWLVIGLLVFPVTSIAVSNGDTEIFKVKVKSSFGTEFDDCFHFFTDGSLLVEGYSGQSVWAYKSLGHAKFRWQSVSINDSTLFSLAFSGTKAFLGLHADGINDNGDTFKIVGKRVKECSLLATADAASGSPYHQ